LHERQPSVWLSAAQRHARPVKLAQHAQVTTLQLITCHVSCCLLPLPPRQVMRMWPFKQLLLRGNAAGADKYALPCRHLHHFGDMQQLREALHLTNLLTGWVRGWLPWEFFLLAAELGNRRGGKAPPKLEARTRLGCVPMHISLAAAGPELIWELSHVTSALPCCHRYVFLVDAQGRLRWCGSGNPSDGEMATLLRCTEQLLEEQGTAQQQGQRQAAAAGV